MVRSSMAVAGMALATLGLFAIGTTNCGGTTNSNTGGASSANTSGASTSSGATTSSSSGSVMLVSPPPAGPNMPTDGTTDTVIAIDKLFIGDTDPNGKADMTMGWEYYGYNIDHVNPSNLAAFCKPVNNASAKTVHTEGTVMGHIGVENAFGHLILPIVLGIASDASTKINQSISQGKFTVMLAMQKLGSGMSYNPIVTQLYAGGDLMGTPSFGADGGIDKWPVRPELLNDADAGIASGSKVQFQSSYLTGNTWVSGSKGTVSLSLTISGQTLSLDISNAVISMQLDAAHKNATNGIISGVLATAQLTSEIQKVAGSIDPTLCSGPTINSILSQIAQASDIMHDGTQDPTKPCDGISIGLGFNGTVVQLGPVAPPAGPSTNPCATDGGADGG